MRLLALDISTTTIGICVLEKKDNGKLKLINKNFYKPPKDGTMVERLFAVKKYFEKLFIKYKIDHLAVEEYIQFMKGGSTAKTVIPLALFNRTICLAYYEMFLRNPTIINVNTVRKFIKINGVTPKKEDVPEFVYKHLKIKYKPLTKTNKKTKLEEVMVENYDVADAIAVGLAFIFGGYAIPG